MHKVQQEKFLARVQRECSGSIRSRLANMRLFGMNLDLSNLS